MAVGDFKNLRKWHSVIKNVHHNNKKCHTGNNIEAKNLKAGTGGKRLCQQCMNLS